MAVECCELPYFVSNPVRLIVPGLIGRSPARRRSGHLTRDAVLRRADRDAASDARRGPWLRPSSSPAVEARAAPWASKVRKHDVADDPRAPEDHRQCSSGAHHSSSSRDGWQRDREGQRPQQSGCPRECLSPSQVAPRDQVGVGRTWHRHSVGRVAHGSIVARYATPASASRRSRRASDGDSPQLRGEGRMHR